MIDKNQREVSMPRFLALLLFAFASIAPAVASDKSDVLAVVHQWVDSYNKGDTKAAAATCADEAVIFDDIPPLEWRGSGACGAWIDSFNAWAKQSNLTFDHAEIAKVHHVEIAADTAYVPTLLIFALKKKDGVVEAAKGTWTLVLKKSSGAWRITGWSWQSLGPVTPPKS
jgi:ketosteroid isomerase-like protein